MNLEHKSCGGKVGGYLERDAGSLRNGRGKTKGVVDAQLCEISLFAEEENPVCLTITFFVRVFDFQTTLSLSAQLGFFFFSYLSLVIALGVL